MRIGMRSLVCSLVLVGVAALCQAEAISKISVRGNQTVSEAFIDSSLRIKVGQEPNDDDLRKEEDNLLSLGVFKTVKVQIITEGTAATLVVDVVEYPVVKEVRVVGNTIVPTKDIEDIVDKYQKSGTIWNRKVADSISRDVRARYEKEGMLVEFNQIGPQEESPNTLTVSVLEPKVGTIELVGLHRTKEKTVERVMKTKPGAPFRRDLLRQDYENLRYGTNWFDDVKADLSPGDTAGETNVKLAFKEARTATFQAGVALDPQSRLVGTLGIGDTNFRGTGESIGLNLSQATTGGGPSAELDFTNRFYDAKDTSLNVRLYSKVVYNFTGSGLAIGSSSTTDTFDERRTGMGLTFSRPINDSHRATWGFNAHRSQTVDLDTTTSNFIQQDGDWFALQLGGEYNTVRGGSEPYKGDAFSVMVEPGYSNITTVGGTLAGANNLLGASNFVRTTGDYRRYWSKEPKKKKDETNTSSIEVDPRPVLAFRTKFGHISGTVPFFEQLFIGGTDSLRGYDNQRFWGSDSILSTFEYRQPVQKSFMVATFVDYGSAWGGYGTLNGFDQNTNPAFHIGYGVGVGFRVQSLGSIRIDFALNGEGGSRTHFSFGSTF